MYNSSVASHEDDSDITIINPSIIHETNDEYVPIIIRLKQANNSSETRQATNSQVDHNIVRNHSSNSKQDYIFIEHNSTENAKQLEQILKIYTEDLKQENNSQLNCDKLLVVRLLDHIREMYSNDLNKTMELSAIQKEIGALHDKRHVEQQEKFEQLRIENTQLHARLLEQKDHLSMPTDHSENNSLLNIADKRHSVNDYEQWTEIEDDAKRLHEVVQSQQNKIDEIVDLISQAVIAQNSLHDNINHDSANSEKQTNTQIQTHNYMNSLLEKIKTLAGTSESSTIDHSQTAILENHSPGASPTQSLSTLTLKSLQPMAANETEQIKSPPEEKINEHHEPIRREEPPARIEVPTIPAPSSYAKEPKRCPVCNQEFSPTSNDEEMYDHIETCLFPTGAATAAPVPAPVNPPAHYECPYCNRKLAGDDETAYLQHLSDCINRDLQTFN